MKKIYAAMVLMSFVNGLAAQPILTDANFNPVVGETGTEFDFDVTGFDPGESGPGATWNYPVLGAPSAHTLNVYSSLTTPHSPHFASCNIAISRAILDYDFYLTETGGLDYYGHANSTANMPLSDPARIFAYPLYFLSVSTDSLKGHFAMGDITTERKGKVVTEADGYGTLVTPVGSFTDVMRIRTVWTYNDEVYDGSNTMVYHHEDIYYFWVIEDVHFPLLTYVIKKTQNGSSTIIGTSGTYLDPESITTGVVAGEAFSTGFVMYPNPARNAFVSLWLRHDKAEQVNLVVWNAAGRQILSNTYMLAGGNNQLLLDTGTLSAGTYFVELSNASGKIVRKLVVE